MKVKIFIYCVLSFSILACAVNPAQKILNDCMTKYGAGRDSSDYWQCNLNNFGPYMMKKDPGNAAFWELYYRAQIGIWKRREVGEMGYEKAKTLSLQLQDQAGQEYQKRIRQMTETEVLSSQAFMQRMQGLATFKQVINQ